MVKGEGCYLWDVENRRYLDFTAGIAVNALGHCDPEMAKLMGQQVGIQSFTSYGEAHPNKTDIGTNAHPCLKPLSQSLDWRSLRAAC